MGRPLKIKQSTTVDIGFNPFSYLTDPTIPTGMTADQYLGVVGGGYPSGIATATNPTVAMTAYVPQRGAETPGYIITQKGATKYLVASNNSVAASSLTPGFSYIIKTVGTTNWAAVGGGTNAQVGDVFTCLANGAGTGTVSDIGVCVLANVASGGLSSGQMQITANVNGGDFQLSKLTNKYAWDYSTPAQKFAADFFVGSGAQVGTDGSGADIVTWTNGNGTYTIAQITDYTA